MFIGLYWNTAMLINLRSVCGCLCTSMAELSNCDRDYMPRKAIYYLAYYRQFASSWTSALIQMRDDNGWGQGSRSSEAWSVSKHVFKWSWQILLMDCLWDVRKQGVKGDIMVFSWNNWKDIIDVTLMKMVLVGTDFEEIIRGSVLDLEHFRCLLAIQV